MSRTLLQVVNAMLAILTIMLATMSLILATKSPIYQAANIPEIPVLDSNLRFFGGMGLGLGLILLWITRNIERHTTLFRSLWFCAFLGGIGRIISLMIVGSPTLPLTIFTIIEVPLVPVLIYWQWRVSQNWR